MCADYGVDTKGAKKKADLAALFEDYLVWFTCSGAETILLQADACRLLAQSDFSTAEHIAMAISAAGTPDLKSSRSGGASPSPAKGVKKITAQGLSALLEQCSASVKGRRC